MRHPSVELEQGSLCQYDSVQSLGRDVVVVNGVKVRPIKHKAGWSDQKASLQGRNEYLVAVSKIGNQQNIVEQDEPDTAFVRMLGWIRCY
jgi:hypothetical protein